VSHAGELLHLAAGSGPRIILVRNLPSGSVEVSDLATMLEASQRG
jgi:hypothetical protein